MELMWMFPREQRLSNVIFEYPSILLGIVLLYLWFVLKAGPCWMATREPFQVKTGTRLFNLAQMLANVWFSYHAISIAFRNYSSGRFSLICNPPTVGSIPLERLDDQTQLELISVGYFFVRLADFVDTIFFVLAKKQSHVTFLHIYHHIAVVTIAYVYLRSGWAPCLYYVSILNSLVHVVMYFYYFLSTFSPLRPFLWWKKYLTAGQIVQFFVQGGQLIMATLYNCGYPPLLCYFNISQVLIFIVLFSNFYVRNYRVKVKNV